LARCSRRRAWHQCLACHGGPDVEYANRPSNILDSLLAAVLEGEVEFVAHLVAHDPADADPARLRQGFKPRRDIDAIAENVPAVNDDVAEVDADAKLDRRPAGTAALRTAISRCTSTAQRTASTTLANSTRIPSPVVLTMRAAMLLDLRIGQFAPDRLQRRERPFLVGAHQPRVAGDISGEDRRQPPLNPLFAQGSHQRCTTHWAVRR
jgi:hypothetical protein